MITKYNYLKKNLNKMGELTLEQIFLLGDCLEKGDYELARQIISKDDMIDDLEKENDNISQTAILDAVNSRREMGMNSSNDSLVLKHDPLRFALSAIRINRSLERICDQIVNIARAYSRGVIRKSIFAEDEDLSLILARVTTIVGMAVESLVEEKERFFGSCQEVELEVNRRCNEMFHKFLADKSMSRLEFADLYRILLSLERIGDVSVNIAEELVRLTTGQDVRHLDHV